MISNNLDEADAHERGGACADPRPRNLTDADVDVILNRAWERISRRTKLGIGGWLLDKFWQAACFAVLVVVVWGAMHFNQPVATEARTAH